MQFSVDAIEQVANAATSGRGTWIWLSKTHPPGFFTKCRCEDVVIVCLIGNKNDVFVELTNALGEIAILSHDASASVDEKENEIRFANGEFGLMQDTATDFTALFRIETTRVDNFKTLCAPDDGCVVTIARGVGDRGNQRGAGFGQAIPQCGFADVCSSHKGDDREITESWD